MFKKIILLIIISLAFVRCSNDTEILINELTSKIETVSHKQTPLEAIDRARTALNLNDNDQTRLSNKIKSIEYISSDQKTRGENTDTLLYLVNYEDNDGFMLLPTDNRLIPVFAYSDNSNLTTNDIENNEVLQDYMEGVKNEVSTIIQLPDSLLSDIDLTFSHLTRVKRIYPKITEYQSKINQADQYNAYCPVIDGKRTPAGCGPVALEILLSFFQYPTVVEGIELPWSLMNIGQADLKIAKLLQILGSKDYMKVKYTTDGTSNYTYIVPPTLKKLGFENAKYIDFDEDNAETYLAKHPLYINIFNPDLGGHAFVIDGMDKYHNTLTPYYNLQNVYYYHFVWGLSGNGNGYFCISNRHVSTLKPVYYWNFDKQNNSEINAQNVEKMIVGLEL
ncbi:MAG: C10 family peptidase [Muribaculaceae bacterium]|nr:C10 family peptidase [Muribaculaceae bacterium]